MDSDDIDDFKKPLFVNKITKRNDEDIHTISNYDKSEPVVSPEEAIQEVVSNKIPGSLNYEEPGWSGIPAQNYMLEVLKNGSIIQTVDLTQRSFVTFGRLTNCDICMQHPTISRHHAVLQYRGKSNEANDCGFYIYDMESTHGTFLNKYKIKSKIYARMKVGHMLKLGCSTRTYILSGPKEDSEEESNLTVTELKQQRLNELLGRKAKENPEVNTKKDDGIDWGLGEDADESTDLSENPYSQTNNEELYLDNPKKTLRGFFEREGLELEYVTADQGIGQFSCRVELPIDDEQGRPVFAEVVHKGKKKEVVVQCALEACRILDRHGLLRQSTHESHKRKPKNWEENDYYDSDDDTFLDRTGTIEKKRELRMMSKNSQKTDTYETLVEKEIAILKTIKKLETELAEVERTTKSAENTNDEVDPLDSFMMELKQNKQVKKSAKKLKSEIIKLKQEHDNIQSLVNLAKPVDLPALTMDPPIVRKQKPISKQKHGPGALKKQKICVEATESSKESKNVLEEEETEDIKMVQSKTSQKPVNLVDSESTKNKTKRIRNNTKIDDRVVKEEPEKNGKLKNDDLEMWVPPTGQSGDGRTSLNDKYGY